MAVTVQGMIGRALLASTPEERQDAEDVATLLMAGSKLLADWRSIIVIDGGTDGTMPIGAAAWDAYPAAQREAILATVADKGWRVIDGRHFRADGKRRAVKAPGKA